MKDIRQSPYFAGFMKGLNWQADKLGNQYIYIRKFPVIGSFAKIPRPNLPIDIFSIKSFIKSNRIFQFKISPFLKTGSVEYQRIKGTLLNEGFQIDNSPYNPTTTIQFDLTGDTEEIFNNFTPAKRRAIRRAIKNNIYIKDSSDIDEFIRIRKKQFSPLGFLLTPEMKRLWENFRPVNTTLLLAYQKHNPEALAGILLLYFDKIAYYWYASAFRSGKKLFAPSLLVWQAIQTAKGKGCTLFDFEGICDERFPKASESWRGFTKFKEGFNGQKVVYCENFSASYKLKMF